MLFRSNSGAYKAGGGLVYLAEGGAVNNSSEPKPTERPYSSLSSTDKIIRRVNYKKKINRLLKEEIPSLANEDKWMPYGTEGLTNILNLALNDVFALKADKILKEYPVTGYDQLVDIVRVTMDKIRKEKEHDFDYKKSKARSEGNRQYREAVKNAVVDSVSNNPIVRVGSTAVAVPVMPVIGAVRAGTAGTARVILEAMAAVLPQGDVRAALRGAASAAKDESFREIGRAHV